MKIMEVLGVHLRVWISALESDTLFVACNAVNGGHAPDIDGIR